MAMGRHGNTKSDRRRVSPVPWGMMAAGGVVLLLTTGVALAVFTVFEAEENANQVVDTPGGQDWANALIAVSSPATIVANGTPPEAVDNPAQPGTALLFYDDISSSGLLDSTIFTQGSKETAPSILPPPEPDGITDWTIVSGNVPPQKDDMSSIYVWSDAPLDNIVLGMERLNLLGSSHLNFGVDHLPWAECPNDADSLCPQRTAGDFIFAYDLTNGGAIVSLRIFTWEIPDDGIQVGPTDGCDGQDPALSGNLGKSCVGGKAGADEYGWEEIVAFAPDVAIHGTNAAAIPAPAWGSFGPGGSVRTTIPQFGFFEAYVNLDALGFVPRCAGAATLSVRSRSSSSFDAELKDLAGPIDLGGGDIDAAATLTGSCDVDGSFTYSVAAFDPSDPNDPIDPNTLTCTWDCSSSNATRPIAVGPFDPDVCSGTGTTLVGDGQPTTITCTVHVTDAVLGCEGDSGDDADVFSPIVVSIAPSPNMLTCIVPGAPGSDNGNVGDGVVFTPTISGGVPPYTLTWSVGGPNEATCAPNAGVCTIDIPDNNFCALSTVFVNVDDGEPLCEDQDSETEVVTKETKVNASDN